MVYLFFPVADLVLNATMTFAVLDVKGDDVVDDVIDVREGLDEGNDEGGGWTTSANVPSVQSVGT